MVYVNGGHPQTGSAGRLGQLALAVMVGIVLGQMVGGLWWWFIPALGCGAGMIWMGFRRRWRGVWCWGLLACVGLSAIWFQTQAGGELAANHIAHRLSVEPVITRLRGKLITAPRVHATAEGPFAAFDYRPPHTRFAFKVEQIRSNQSWHPVRGTLLATCRWAEIDLDRGDSIEALGWMRRLARPRNPGEPDYAAALADKGIVGALTIRNRANLDRLGHARTGLHARLIDLRDSWNEAASNSLALGLRDQPKVLTLLKMLLLGDWDQGADKLKAAFRRVGLAHLLSISGAHLGILLGLSWILARLFVHRPARVVLIVLAVLGMYLLTVPIRLPIMRASIMAGLLCLANLSGRRISSFAALAAAAILVLIWRPSELFEPGFQLSFLAVAALMRFTGPLANRIAPPPALDPGRAAWTLGRRVWKGLAEYLAASVVVFVAVLPVVAYHFQLISPLAIALALLSLPVFTTMLGLGYLKVILGFLTPSLSLLLSSPLAWASRVLIELVQCTDHLPYASVALTYPPTLAWVGSVLVCCLAVGVGFFEGRPIPLASACVILVCWTWGGQHPTAMGRMLGRPQPVMTVRALAVGDGSCFVIRSGGRTWMFDCGSQRYFDVGSQTIVPALKRLGIDRIDTLVISHADMDHFVGTLDLVEALEVDRVLVTRQMLGEADDQPNGPTAFLVDRLSERGIAPKPIAKGWHEQHAGTSFDVLWPAEDFLAKRTNDASIVLSVEHGQARLLLTGDIMAQAMKGLLRANANLSATVSDLPHHGGFVEPSPIWLEAVHPRLALQSVGYGWQKHDHWPGPLNANHVRRLITQQRGMVSVKIFQNGEVRSKTFIPE